MANKHEIHDNMGIATLELLEAVRSLTSAHSNLLLGHFDQAKADLRDVSIKVRDAVNYIPEESGE